MAGTNPALVIRIAATMDELRRNLAEGKASIEALSASANKMAASFQGDKLAQQAANMAAAIQQVGGVAKLTAAEQARANSVFERAAEKLTLMGRAADPVTQEYKRLADATKRADTDTGFFATTIGKLTAAFSIASLIDRAVTSIISWGREAVVSAGAMVDLSSKTGLSLDTLQRMSFVAQQSGTDINTFTTAAFNLGVRLSGGGNSVVAAVNALGLSYQNLKAQSPDAQFAATVGALGKMENAQARNAAGVALFGKTFKDIAASIEQDYIRLANGAKVSSDEQIKAVDAASKRWTAFYENTKTTITSFLGTLVMNHDKAKGLDWLIVVGFDPNEVKKGIANISAWWDALRGKIAKQPLVPASSFKDMVGDPLVLKDIPADLDAIEASFTKLTLASGNATRSHKAFLDGVDRANARLFIYGSMTLPEVTDRTLALSNMMQGLLADGTLPVTQSFTTLTGTIGLMPAVVGRLGTSVEELGEDWTIAEERARVATLHLYGGLTNLFDALARLTGSDFLQWLGDVAAGITIAKQANLQLDQSLKDAGKNVTAQAAAYAQWGASVVSALDQATQSASKWKAALGGMMAGAQAGSAGGGAGIVIGAIVGLFVGLIKSEDKLAAARRAAIDSIVKERAAFVELAGGMAALTAKADLAGVSLEKLFQFQGDAAAFKAEIDRINAAFAAWEKRIAGLNQAAGGLGSMTAGFAAPFTKPLADLDTLQKSLPGLKIALVDALKAGEPKGIKDAQIALNNARGDIKLIEVQLKQMATKGQAEFDRLGNYAVATFAGILKETGSLSQAFAAVGPSLDTLISLQGSLGFTSSATVQALLDIRKVVNANQSVMQSVDGLNQVMAGLTSAGMVNQTLFTAFGQDATALFAKLQVGGATSSQALALMQPTLQTLWQQQKDFGFETDEATKALIDEAVKIGLVGEKHKPVSEKMLDALGLIKDAIDKLTLALTGPTGVTKSLGDLGGKTRVNQGEWTAWGNHGVAQAIRVQRGLDAIEFPDLSDVPGPGGGVPSSMTAQSSSSSRTSTTTQGQNSSTVGDVHVHFGSSPSSFAEAEEKGFIVADTVIKLLETNAGGRRTKARKALRVA